MMHPRTHPCFWRPIRQTALQPLHQGLDQTREEHDPDSGRFHATQRSADRHRRPVRSVSHPPASDVHLE